MSTEKNEQALENLSREELMSALFANLVFQNTNMALMLMGRVPHPESGKNVTDLEAARMFVDQLEMLEVKTKGNLSKEEERLLQQSLMHVRMAFVESVRKGPAPEQGAPPASQPAEPQAAKPAEPPAAAASTPSEAAEDAESHKRFTKKY